MSKKEEALKAYNAAIEEAQKSFTEAVKATMILLGATQVLSDLLERIKSETQT